MWLKRIKRTAEKNRNELLGIILRRYPPFIWSDVKPAEVPAFAFHSVAREFLEPLLRYLAENRYATLTADEYMYRVAAGERGSEREVLLTFDDGHENLYTVVFPLLKRFGQKAVAYIVPGRMSEGNNPDSPYSYTNKLCSWAQIRELHESDVVDVQSHSMYHHSVAVSDRLAGFLKPEISTSFLESDFSPLFDEGSDAAETPGRNYGFPIYEWGARMGPAPAFRESLDVSQACMDYVASHGGEGFFKQRGWQGRLRKVMRAAEKYYGRGSYETAEEQRKAILKDLFNSKAEIDQKLNGKVVRHFCFPWFRGSAIAAELAGEAGYKTNAWGSLLPNFIRHSSSMPIPIRRLPPKYIPRLPGNRRSSLLSIFTRPAGGPEPFRRASE